MSSGPITPERTRLGVRILIKTLLKNQCSYRSHIGSLDENNEHNTLTKDNNQEEGGDGTDRNDYDWDDMYMGNDMDQVNRVSGGNEDEDNGSKKHGEDEDEDDGSNKHGEDRGEDDMGRENIKTR